MTQVIDSSWENQRRPQHRSSDGFIEPQEANIPEALRHLYKPGKHTRLRADAKTLTELSENLNASPAHSNVSMRSTATLKGKEGSLNV